MNATSTKYFSISYSLYDVTNGKHELVEKTSEDKHFEFVSGMGIAIDAFEQNVKNLNTGDSFNFTLTPAEAYGEIDETQILDLDKTIFVRDGKFDEEHIQEDAIVPLKNSDGNIFYGRVVSISEDKVRMDLNHPLAGRHLYFEGKIEDTHEATAQEIAKWASQLTGDDENSEGCNHENGHHCCHHDGETSEHHCCHHHDKDTSESQCCHHNDEEMDEHQCCCHHKDKE